MIFHARRGQVSYGEDIGILMLDSHTPFIQGDVGNAHTCNFPVRYQVIPGLTVEKALEKDVSVLQDVMAAAKQLVSQGVRAVTADCGYLVMHQEEVANNIDVPVFLSSLLQLPFMLAMLPPGKKPGILCADETRFIPEMLAHAGVHDPSRVIVRGMQDGPAFADGIIRETGTLDSRKVRDEVVERALLMVGDHPEVGAMLLECSVLPPYAAAVQEAVGLPVFDYVTMINYVHTAVVARSYPDSF